MTGIRLNHIATYDLAVNKTFDHISTYDQMNTSIVKFGKTKGKADTDEYHEAVGAAFEVFAEFFFRRYGTSANPLLGVKCVEETSRNKYQAGYDFTYEDFNGQPAYIQVKFRKNENYKFTRNDLGTFISIADEMGITSDRRILFTSIDEPSRDKGGLFHHSYQGGLKQMRVIARNIQEEFIDRDPSFWNDLRESVELALSSAVEFTPVFESREHQLRMEAAQERVFNLELSRGKVIAATGAGKTLVIFKGVKRGFLDLGFKLQVVVAPTIDLLRQHHAYFERFGLFHNDNISVIHFRTGEESRTDTFFEYQQTTTVSDLNLSGQQLIFVTYKSEENLFSGLKDLGIEADCVFWDEFHHTIRQKIEYRDHITSIPTKRNLFFSASEKQGQVIDSFDESIYGPTLINVTYKELREKGILVPKLVIKPIFIDIDHPKIHGIERSFQKSAKENKWNLIDGVMEAAGTIIARQNMIDTVGKCNLVTFSKAVPICKEITSNLEIRDFFGEDLNTVHSGIPSKERDKIYKRILRSDDSVLCQHSIVKEGIDINPFNSIVMSRTMEVIGVQQGLGRIARANPEDTKNFEAGLLSLDDPTGWIKYQGTVYVIITSQDMAEFKDFVKDLIVKLETAGLTKKDYSFGEILEERTGVAKPDDDWVAKKNPLVYGIIQSVSIKDVIANAHIEIENDYIASDVSLKKFKIKQDIESAKTIEELIKKFEVRPLLIFEPLNKNVRNTLHF
jgi:superfamily II DNA or RNA helicase